MSDAVDRLARKMSGGDSYPVVTYGVDEVRDRLNDALILLSTPSSGMGPCNLNRSPKYNWV